MAAAGFELMTMRIRGGCLVSTATADLLENAQVFKEVKKS